MLYTASWGPYSCYRSDVNYVQGMSFSEAGHILNQEEVDAFIAFGNLMNKSFQLAFFCVDCSKMLKFLEYSKHSLRTTSSNYFFTQVLWPCTRHILDRLDLHTVSQIQLLDLACLVWGVFCRDGEEFLLRSRLGISKVHEGISLQIDFIHTGQFLTWQRKAVQLYHSHSEEHQ